MRRDVVHHVPKAVGSHFFSPFFPSSYGGWVAEEGDGGKEKKNRAPHSPENIRDNDEARDSYAASGCAGSLIFSGFYADVG